MEAPPEDYARITKMKDGSTHMAHKAEHAVDMESGAVIAVTLQAACIISCKWQGRIRPPSQTMRNWLSGANRPSGDSGNYL